MIVQRFLAWAPTAPASQRAEGAGALARAYLYSDLSGSDKKTAEAALTMLLDDPSIAVRRNISEAFAASRFTPRHILRALAHDTPEIAVPVLMMSPLLHDRELIEILPIRGEQEQAAIASRDAISPRLAAAIVDLGRPLACAVLARNPNVELEDSAYVRMAERYGDDVNVRDALLDQRDLPVPVRQNLMLKVAERLRATAVDYFCLDAERVRRLTQDACERATLTLANDVPDAIGSLVSHLRQSEQLTPALIVRALLRGDLDFVEAALAELSSMDVARVRVHLDDPVRAGFRALYRASGLPASVYTVFCEALQTWIDMRDCDVPMGVARYHVAARALAVAEQDEISGVMDILSRMASEAAREQAMDILKPLEEQAKLAAA